MTKQPHHPTAPAKAPERAAGHDQDQEKIKAAREVLLQHFASEQAVEALEVFIRAVSSR